MNKDRGIILAAILFLLVSSSAVGVLRYVMDNKKETTPSVDWSIPDTAEVSKETEMVEEPPKVEPEPAKEPYIEESDTEKEQSYYRFTVSTVKSFLNCRATPDKKGKVVGRLKSGTQGYVLETGDDWTLITTGKVTGYVSGEYIELEEISKEEFPKDYLGEPLQEGN